MELDNKPRAAKIKLLGMLFPLLVIFAVALSYLLIDVRDLSYVFIAVGTLAIYFSAMALLRLYYVSFYVGPDKIRVRYTSLMPFRSPNNSIQIKSENFHHYVIKSRLGGLIKILYLYQNTPGGVGKYPSVGITTLTKEQIAQVKKAFDLIKVLKKNPHQ